MKIHPAAELFPRLEGSELASLVESIRRDGLIHPCVRHEGVLLDGRNRLAACQLAGVEPRWVEYTGDSPVAYILATNLERRHLTVSQRAMLAPNLEEHFREEARVRQAAGQERGREAREIGSGQICPEPKEHRARDDMATALGVSPRTVESALRVAKADPELADKVRAGELTVGGAEKILKPHVANNTGDFEWYTPADICERARLVLGRIELDPASCAAANEVVGAERFYTIEDDGLSRPWACSALWMNPPYAKGVIERFVAKLLEELGDIEQAMVLVNNGTETAWFQDLAERASAVCFPRARVRFWRPGGGGSAPLQGQAILYFGESVLGFLDSFRDMGRVFLAEEMV